MGNHNTTITKFHKFWKNILDHRCIDHHIVSNRCQLLNAKRNRDLRIDKRRKPIDDRTVLYLNCANLNNPVRLRTKSGRL